MMDAAAENKIRANEAAFDKDMAAPKSRQASALRMDQDIERHIQAMLHGEDPDWEEFKCRLGRSSGPESERVATRRREPQEFPK
jgi:hypothetical protein